MTYSVIFEHHESRAELVVWEDDSKTATLSNISSKYKRRGLASKVMKLALAYADALGLDVVLSVMPFGDGPKMLEADLKAWYMTWGFQYQGDDVMLRPRVEDKEPWLH